MSGPQVTWTPDQKSVFRFESNLCVLAGAGSGKTMTLVELVLRLLAGRTPHPAGRVGLEHVLALTYTEKAAREMRERLRVHLNRMISKTTGRADERLFWLGQRRQLDRAQIGTIHGFCRRVLKEHAFEAGLDPDFRILEDDADLQEDTLRDLLLARIAAQDADLLSLLTHMPWLSRGRSPGLNRHLADLAGQSRTLGRALRADFEAHRDASAALAALRQAATLAHGLIRDGSVKSGTAYFNQVSGFVERMNAVTNEADLATAVLELKERLKGGWYKASAAKDIAQEAIDTLRAALDLKAALPLKERLLALAREYEAAFGQAKARRYSLDFDDLLLWTRDLLAGNLAVRGRLKSRFRVLLVDEFQDTNRLQAEILAYLLEPESRAEAPSEDASALDALAREDRKLVVFGDPKQSIYRFRGADVSVFNRLRTSLTNAAAAPAGQGVVPLAVNFRSRRPLVDFYNAFFGRVMPQGVGDFWAAYGPQDRQRPSRGPASSEGWPAVEILEYEGNDKAAEEREREAQALAGRIATLLLDGRPTVTDEDRAPGPGDVTILLRRFTYLNVYEQALRRAGLPFYTVRGRGFYRCQEVWDLINLLFFLADPRDESALLGLLRSPLAGLSDDTLTHLAWPSAGLPRQDLSAYFFGDPPPAPPDLSPGQAQAFARIHAVLHGLLGKKAGRAFVAELVETAVEETDYLAVLMALPEGEQKTANVQRFIEIVRRLPAEALYAPTEAARHFRRRLDGGKDDPEAALSPEGSGAIQIMTIHQAKGLEFPIVFVPDAGQPPRTGNARLVFGRENAFGLAFDDPETGETRRGADYLELKEEEKQKEEAEYLRLLYVAATRAKDFLIFSGHAKKKAEKSWRGLLDAFAEAHPEMIKVRPALEEGRAGPRPLPASPPEPAMLPEPGDKARALVARALDRASLRPSRLNVSVTNLAAYLLCPRRYFLQNVLGLPDRPDKGKGEESGERGGLAPDQKGTLLHALLEAVDLARPQDPATLASLARDAAQRNGFHLPAGEDAALADLTQAFLESTWGRDMVRGAQEGRVWRELPFNLRIDPAEEGAPILTLTGVIDLFYVTPEGIGRLVDYKYSPESHPERYERQVACYALALKRAGRAEDLEAGLYFTHEHSSTAQPVNLSSGWEDRLEQELSRAALDLARLHGTNPATPERLDPCPDPGCGLGYLCRGNGAEKETSG